MTSRTPKAVVGSALRDYFMQYVRPSRSKRHCGQGKANVPGEPPRMFVVTQDMPAFKKAVIRTDRKVGESVYPCRTEVIVNLTIPKGAYVYTCVRDSFDDVFGSPTYRKMRASQAVVHSISSMSGHKQYPNATADYAHRFFYVPGKTVRPTRGFDSAPLTCASGIHFFLNLQDAKKYHF